TEHPSASGSSHGPPARFAWPGDDEPSEVLRMDLRPYLARPVSGKASSGLRNTMVLCTAATLLALGGCGADGPTELSRVSDPSSAVVDVAEVADLTVAAVGDSSVTLTWTQVDD